MFYNLTFISNFIIVFFPLNNRAFFILLMFILMSCFLHILSRDLSTFFLARLHFLPVLPHHLQNWYTIFLPLMLTPLFPFKQYPIITSNYMLKSVGIRQHPCLTPLLYLARFLLKFHLKFAFLLKYDYFINGKNNQLELSGRRKNFQGVRNWSHSRTF